MPKSKKESAPPPETQFVPTSDDDEELFAAVQILDERVNRYGRGEYLVQWLGKDPQTGEDWKPTWEAKSSCTDILIQEWKEAKKKDPGLMGRVTRQEAEGRKKGAEEKKRQAEEKKKEKQARTAEGRKASSPLPERSDRKRKRGSSAATNKSDKRLRGSSENSTYGSPSKELARNVQPKIKALGNKSNLRNTANSRRRSPGSDHQPIPIEATTAVPSESQPPVPNEQVGSEQATATHSPLKTRQKAPKVPPVSTSPDANDLTAFPIAADLDPVPPLRPEQLEQDTSAEPPEDDSVAEVRGAAASKASKSPSTIALSSQTPRTTTPPRTKAVTSGKTLGSIPQPPPSGFQQSSNARRETADATQFDPSVSTSQADPIVEFPSPAAQNTKPRGVPPVGRNGQQESAESVPVRLVEKVIGGEVWLMDSQSQTSSAHSDSAQAKDTANDAQIAYQGASDDADLEEFHSPELVAQSIPEISVAEKKATSVTTPSHFVTQSQDLKAILEAKDVQIALLGNQVAELESNLEQFKTVTAVSASERKDANERIQSLIDRVTEMTAIITALEDKLQNATKSKESISGDLDFFKGQYQNASMMAVENAQRANALEEQVATLRKQLDIGLKQKSLHYEAIQRKREEENVKLRKQTKLLLDQARLTDDTVRAKAVAFDALKIENAALVKDNEIWEKNYDSLQMRNEELVEQLTMLRGKRMGVFEEDSDTESDDEHGAETDADLAGGEGYLGSRYVSPSRSTSIKPPIEVDLVYGAKLHQQDNMSTDGYTQTEIMPGESQLDIGQSSGRPKVAVVQSRGDVASDEVEGGLGFVCKWNAGHGQCPMMFDTQQGLREHARDHVHAQGSRGDEVHATL